MDGTFIPREQIGKSHYCMNSILGSITELRVSGTALSWSWAIGFLVLRWFVEYCCESVLTARHRQAYCGRIELSFRRY